MQEKGLRTPIHGDLPTRLTAFLSYLPRSQFRSKSHEFEKYEDSPIIITWSVPYDGSVTGCTGPEEGELPLIVYVFDIGNTATTYTDTETDLDPRHGYHVKAQNAHRQSDVSNFARIYT